MVQKLREQTYLRFPFRINEDGGVTSGRGAHVREQIEQVLFTEPGERVFRPEFGVGVRRLVFEPNASALVEMVRGRLQGSLSEALQGEVDPRSLTVNVTPGPEASEQLIIEVSYTLATIAHHESHRFAVGPRVGRERV